VSPLRGEKPQNWPLSKLNTGRFALRAMLPVKNLLSSNISSICPHNMVNFSPLTDEIGLPVWDNPANFNRFRVLASLLQRHRSTEANQTLHDL